MPKFELHLVIPGPLTIVVERSDESTQAVLRKLDRIIKGQETQMAKYAQIKEVIDAIKANSDAEALENQQQTAALEQVAAAIQALKDQVAQGTPGISEADADQVLNDLNGIAATVAGIRARELAQTARLTELGTTEVIPDPVPEPGPVEPEPV